MIINNSKTISEVQEEFNTMFPYLKIEFYSKGHKTGEGSPSKEIIPSELNIVNAGKKERQGELKIYDSMQVCELEQQFEQIYGLHVQVWRKSGSIWLQTISTDSWTLEAQNDHGKQSMQEHKV